MGASVVVLGGAAIVKVAPHVKAWGVGEPPTARVERSGVAGHAVADPQLVLAQGT